MASLGPDVYCGQLTIQDNLKVGGAVTSSHKVFGNALNEGQLHHNGSVFYIKWSAVHQCSHLTTANGVATATWTTTAAHNLQIGDVVHIGKPVGAVVSVHDIPFTELIGTHVVTDVPTATTFTYTTTTPANADGTVVAGTPHVRIDRYKSIDLATNIDTWTHGTTVPTPTHTNIENFYF